MFCFASLFFGILSEHSLLVPYACTIPVKMHSNTKIFKPFAGAGKSPLVDGLKNEEEERKKKFIS